MFQVDVPIVQPVKKQKVDATTNTDKELLQNLLQKELDEEKAAHENTKSQLALSTREHDFEKKRKDDLRDEFRGYPKCPRR